MPDRRHLVLVLIASIASLAVGTVPIPFWDEDEPRFAAIASTMMSTGDWIVPMYNGELAVDKPVLMHWAMAAAGTLCGESEIAARLPAVIATLLTALALLRAGTRWFDATTGSVAALAFVGCLLVGIEAHAATPDAILTCLTAWATILFAEPLLATQSDSTGLPRLSGRRAALVGGLLGLAVLCKGPIGCVGPLAVVLPWTWWLAMHRRLGTAASGGDRRPLATRLATTALPAAWDTLRTSRMFILCAGVLAVAAPWYVAVSLRTDGAWLHGFFFIHNVGRFVAPMEKHSGSVLLHPLAMLVGFYPWSCFLPLAAVVAAWRVARTTEPFGSRATLGLVLFWIAVWVGGFSLSATKLPNYVLPAYPAAALLVAAVGVRAAQGGRWPHPGWMAAGVASLALGGAITAAVVLIAGRFGVADAAPAALVGIVPVVGSACLWYWRREPLRAIAALAVTGLVYTGLATGPAAACIARANALPALVQEAHRHAGGRARIGTFPQITPNVVYYAHGPVTAWREQQREEALRFLASGPDAVVLVPEDRLAELSGGLPEGVGVIGRGRPLFREQDFLLVGTRGHSASRTAALGSSPR
jgi:4-amino-4-deoxy-L-arabinose transferase-like glycosyltransferase